MGHSHIRVTEHKESDQDREGTGVGFGEHGWEWPWVLLWEKPARGAGWKRLVVGAEEQQGRRGCL